MTNTMMRLMAGLSFLLPVVLQGQTTAAAGMGLDPATLTQQLAQPATTSWPTYAGDYSQRRYSVLDQVNRTNVKDLTLAWKSVALTAGPGGGAGARRGFGSPGFVAPTIVGGVTETPVPVPGSSSGSPRITGSILQVNGVLYISSPDNAWAMDARDGTVLWHYCWTTRGGDHIGNRGMAMYGDTLYFEVPEDYLVALDAKTGKERWHKEIAPYTQQYFSTTAPVVVGNHVLVGTSSNLDQPGFLQSFNAETGELQWKTFLVPMKKGDPGWDTWGSMDAAQHGGAMPWLSGSYDPETKLYIFGTGNPIPAYSAAPRGKDEKDTNLFTCSIVALDVETGKMAWYYQTSPDDTHDWDSVQAPVFVDGTFEGKPRKLVMEATRNGYFFVLDRVTGQHLLTTKYSPAANWATGLNANGNPIRDPDQDSTVAGSLVSPTNGGAVNWQPPSFSPQTGLFYVGLHQGYAMYYLTQTDPKQIMGLGGKEEDPVGSYPSSIVGIDYRTGKTVYNYVFPGDGSPTGLLTTAGHLLFSGDGSGNLVAYDTSTPKPLWHARIGNVSNAPETYLLDGRQYILTVTGDTVYAFRLSK
ncbi:acido-empty-quinoprotein group A [Terriglobus sp. TAA 43]|uniref:acido-empty-quinoprotein group A n=1 Tax=Terriglobus sp. TAA 43 TaxID=278961 RepID=UPI001E55DA74|nr:acido-empty-quinoprotein group A [Terriglobus sp. TAA 43]